MNQPAGIYIGCTTAELQEMRTDAIQLLKNLRTAHQSYSVAQREVNRVKMEAAQQDVMEIDFALRMQAGTLVRTTVADMSRD